MASAKEAVIPAEPEPVDETLVPVKPTQLRQRKITPDTEEFLRKAQLLAMKNYNERRENESSPKLSEGTVYISSFMKVLGSLKATVASTVVRGIIWEVTLNTHRNEYYMDVYKKINNVRVYADQI